MKLNHTTTTMKKKFYQGDIVRFRKGDLICEGIVDDENIEEHQGFFLIEHIFCNSTDSTDKESVLEWVHPSNVELLIPWKAWRNLPLWRAKDKSIPFRRGDVVRMHCCEPQHNIPWVVKRDEDEEGMVALFGWEGMDGRVCAANLYRVRLQEGGEK